jgi:hypothetical protein
MHHPCMEFAASIICRCLGLATLGILWVAGSATGTLWAERRSHSVAWDSTLAHAVRHQSSWSPTQHGG